ncbi:MAG: hypothetical protein ABJ308_09165 [Halieaceae bacterium]
MSDTFDHNFKTILGPVLEELGFKQVKLKDCMCPQYLFNNGQTWFALSWDWRDQYLEVSLGRLYWFKDVMERVVVIGDYSHYESTITPSAMSTLGSDETIFSAISSSLESALDIYRDNYAKIYEDFRVTRSMRGGINIDEYIGPEVAISELEKFKGE